MEMNYDAIELDPSSLPYFNLSVRNTDLSVLFSLSLWCQQGNGGILFSIENGLLRTYWEKE